MTLRLAQKSENFKIDDELFTTDGERTQKEKDACVVKKPKEHGTDGGSFCFRAVPGAARAPMSELGAHIGTIGGNVGTERPNRNLLPILGTSLGVSSNCV